MVRGRTRSGPLALASRNSKVPHGFGGLLRKALIRKEYAMETLKLSVQGMSCGGCVRHVTQALQAVPGTRVEEVKVGSATVAIDTQRTSREALVEAVRNAGYEVGEVVTAR